MFEHRLYLPSMFACLMAVTLAYQCKTPDWLRAGLLCALIAVFSFWTYERNYVWIDEVTLWKDCAQKSKGKARPHNNLGHALADQGKLDEAIAHYSEALRIKPGFRKARRELQFALKKQAGHCTLKPDSSKPSPSLSSFHNNKGGKLIKAFPPLSFTQSALKLN